MPSNYKYSKGVKEVRKKFSNYDDKVVGGREGFSQRIGVVSFILQISYSLIYYLEIFNRT